ncbi:MAG: SMP-30/gluconolactonase/LRE family protein [Gemmataceae bacterium]
MYLPRACALVGLIAAFWPHVAAEKRLPRENLLVYRGADGQPAPVRTAEDWAKRRAEVVRGMELVMGKLPGAGKRCPLDPKTEEEVDGGTYVRRLITYASEPGCRVPAYLLIPKDVLAGKKKVPAVLCLHGTNNVVGHGIVVGLGGVKNRGYAVELAQRGYVTLAPNYPLLAKYQPDLAKLGWESGTLKAVWDNMRGLDLLAALPFVDGSKMGTIGHSLGGHNSVYTAVFDDRLKAVVTSCGLDSYLDYYDGDEKNWAPERGWCQTRYMRKLADYKGRLADIPFDFHEMVGALAPRHVLIIAPKKDSNFRADSVDRVAAAARPVFKLLGHEERLKVEHPDCEHDFPPQMRELAYRLFDAVLSGQETSEKIPGLGPTGPAVQLHTKFTFTEGPAADRDGNVYFTDIPNQKIHKVDTAGKLTLFRDKSNRANGLMVNARGEVVACEMAGQVVAYSADGKERRVLADKHDGKRFNAPNDLVLDRAGGIYFTDPGFGAPAPLPQGKTAVYYLAADGKTTRLIDDLPNPNGVILSPDEKTLYVIPSGQADMMSYPVEGPGKLGRGKVFCTLKQAGKAKNSGGDGLTVDVKGNLYITSQLGLQVFDPAGKFLDVIKVPEPPANVTFGGADFKTLYVTARTSLYTVPMEVAGHQFARGK